MDKLLIFTSFVMFILWIDSISGLIFFFTRKIGTLDKINPYAMIVFNGAGHEINFFSDSHLAPKFFKVVAK